MRGQKTATRNFLKNARLLLETVPESSNSALSSHKKTFFEIPHQIGYWSKVSVYPPHQPAVPNNGRRSNQNYPLG